MNYDSMYHPYPSFRAPTYARKGMVATSQPLAAQAGLDILKQGGNAIDAAIATAAALTVVEPCSNGIGGDAFALVWTGGKLHGLNSSGPAPQSISIDGVRAAGHNVMPSYGAIPVTVPGAPAAWAELSRKFGKLSLAEVLQPAIRYAKEGYPVSPIVAHNWAKSFAQYEQVLKGDIFKPWFDTFAPGGRPPAAGEIWRSSTHAHTLELIGASEARAFYEGELAERMDAFISAAGGYLTADDLSTYRPEWVNPISTSYRGHEVWEIPPNGQGLVALLALRMMSGFEDLQPNTVDTYHKQIEAMKLAFADGHHYITDPARMKLDTNSLLSTEYTNLRRGLIGERARLPEVGKPVGGGTVYLATADGEGNMVSFIQSNYMQFGSGLVVPGTGIALQNRGRDFSLDENHANRLEPGKRTYHTIIPGFLTRDGEAVGPFGVMGGIMQPQGHLQTIMNTLDFGLHPQAALDAPRWQWVKDNTVWVESGFSTAVAQALSRRGHDIQIALDPSTFGRGQIIWRDPHTGVLCGGTDSRADGIAAAW
ncbi:gamma-glutamyltransferase family protein [Paenibacillus sp. FSL H7-0331]|uniref:gamma-glutamyltransferase family protein n=1 Tax=Paenibacillus sp. FSL H7-0331 TaxID=1920421 RepID=UPI00096D618C|nr:gamma-glutamyltransferase family protein [Paenibacillus sp. FSL H7-0331]OMF04321.1 gamma-glutamyltransferase [Paenibacillus sp. FSL H7-0331]